MREQTRKSDIGNLLALLLFAVFAVCVLSVLLTGADAYRRLTQRDQDSFQSRTVAQYLATRVRQADSQGGVTIKPFGDGDALVLTEKLDGETYFTWVYCYDGALRELFTSADSNLPPESGEEVLSADALQLELDNGLLTVQVLENDVWQTVTLSLRSGEGAAS
jgi:type II secretory pathway component PulJ